MEIWDTHQLVRPGLVGKLIVFNDFVNEDDWLSRVAPAAGPNVGGLLLGNIALHLADPTGLVFTSAALPTTLDLRKFAFTRFSVRFCQSINIQQNPNGFFCLGGDGVSGSLNNLLVTTLDTQPVPEPGSFGLAAVGLLAWRMNSRRKRAVC